MMRRGIVVEEDERTKSNRPCGGNEGLSLVTLTIIARAEVKSCLDYAKPQGGKARFSGIKEILTQLFFQTLAVACAPSE